LTIGRIARFGRDLSILRSIAIRTANSVFIHPISRLNRPDQRQQCQIHREPKRLLLDIIGRETNKDQLLKYKSAKPFGKINFTMHFSRLCWLRSTMTLNISQTAHTIVRNYVWSCIYHLSFSRLVWCVWNVCSWEFRSDSGVQQDNTFSAHKLSGLTASGMDWKSLDSRWRIGENEWKQKILWSVKAIHILMW
jgi:hypothetical protein